MQHRRSKKPVFLILILLLLAGMAFLGFKDIPAPAGPVERPISLPEPGQ